MKKTILYSTSGLYILLTGFITVFFLTACGNGTWDEVAESVAKSKSTKGSSSEKMQDTAQIVELNWLGTLDAAPANAEKNMAYYSALDGVAYIYNGEAWNELAKDGASISWLGSFDAAPSEPMLNDAYYNNTLGISYIWDGSSWNELARDGNQGPQGQPGLAIAWQGSLTMHPSNPQLNWAYYNTVANQSYIYDGSNWQTLALDGEPPPAVLTQNFATGNYYISGDGDDEGLYIDANGNVGIGNTAPSQKLEVTGGLQIGTGSSLYDYSPGNGPGALIIKGNSSDYRIVHNDGTGNFHKYYNAYSHNNGTSWVSKYLNDGAANQIQSDITLGQFDFKVAGPGTAGNDITWQTALYINNAGNVGIRTSTIGFNFVVAGSAGKPGGGSWSDSSDIRLKKNIKPLRNALNKILQLQGYEYEWINPEEHSEGLQAGLIAQQVETIFPDWIEDIEAHGLDQELIPQDEKSKALHFPHSFNAYIIEALKELKQEKDDLQVQYQDDKKNLIVKLNELENENTMLKTKVAKQEERIARLEKLFLANMNIK